MGDDPTESNALKVELHPSVSKRWCYWLINGLPKPIKEDLLQKYERPSELEAPKLNAEISATLAEAAIKRDKHMLENQQLAGSALTALGSAVSMILEPDEEGLDRAFLLQTLCDSAKYMTDIVHNLTVSRKACIEPGLSKDIRTVLQDAKTDTYLYGLDLKDKIKEARAVEKLSQNLKNQPKSSTSVPFKRNLNFKGPQTKRYPYGQQMGQTNSFGYQKPKLFFKNKQRQFTQKQNYTRQKTTTPNTPSSQNK